MSSKWVLSATEIETFETCRRKWAYLYLDGIKPPSSKAAQFGTLVHGFLRNYLIGYQIDHQSQEGQVAKPGLSYLPSRLPEENTERPIFFLTQGHIFHGYIDFFDNVGCQTWLIGDHKTTADLNRALTGTNLKKDIQANIYAQWAFSENRAETVRLRWIYYRTKSTPKAICVEAELSKAEAEENFIRIAKIADEITSIVKDKPASAALHKNTNSCFKYGPCPFYAKCKSTPHVLHHSKHPITPSAKDVAMASSFHLYVDCAPTKIEHSYERTIELSDLLKPVLNKIQTEKELSHYRLAGYGQHVGLIANYLSEHLKNSAYDQRTAILSSIKSPEGCDTLQTLSAAAGMVVRGF